MLSFCLGTKETWGDRVKFMFRRDKELTAGRMGRTKVTYKVTYRLLPNDQESAIIEQHSLSRDYMIGDPGSPHSLTLAELIEGGVYTETSADLVLKKEALALKAARNAAISVANVMAFDGENQTIDLNSVNGSAASPGDNSADSPGDYTVSSETSEPVPPPPLQPPPP